MIKFYPELSIDNEEDKKFLLTEEGWLTIQKVFSNENAMKGDAPVILDTIMRFILKPLIDISWKVYDDNIYQTSGGAKTAHLTNILRYRFAKVDIGLPLFMTSQQYEGSVWNLMSRLNFKPFTELFVDTRDRWEVNSNLSQLVNEECQEDSGESKGQLSEEQGRWNHPATMFGKKDGAQAVVVYMNTPFDKTLWKKLRMHEVDDVDIISENLSFSDRENYNLFWAGTTLTMFSDFDLKRANPPLMNIENAKRYGLKPLEVSIEGMELLKEEESSQTVTLQEVSKKYSQKLKDWFENNSEYLSGTMELRGKGSIKVGQKLLKKSTNEEFYIEGVTQNFQVFGSWNTTTTVTRGQQKLR
jgi:hypothetical protein